MTRIDGRTAVVTGSDNGAGRQPLGRQAQPAEVAAVALLLASDASSSMTGWIVPVRGGCTTTSDYGEASN